MQNFFDHSFFPKVNDKNNKYGETNYISNLKVFMKKEIYSVVNRI